MQIVLIADTFPPLRTSGAVQLRDLSREFMRQGHNLTVLLPSPNLEDLWRVELVGGVRVLYLKAPRTKDIGYVRRTLAECIMPFAMFRGLRKSPLANEQWDGVVWYAPSIFHGPLASMLIKASGCKGYLIIRDIFPDWAVDMGLMGRGLRYAFFDAVARYQYSVAHVIGVQTHSNRRYFDRWENQPNRRLEVLQNWLDQPGDLPCSIRLNETSLAGRKVFVYAGNMGVAQGMDILLDLAKLFRDRSDVGFLFVGRGNDWRRLRLRALDSQLDNVLFHDEIPPDEVPDLYSQCSAGIVALDFRHKTHNIPGKFLTYMQSGLPVLANVNAGNDLVQIIRDENVGQVCENNQLASLADLADKLLAQIASDGALSLRCRALFDREFTVDRAVRQIVTALSV
jgi:glycosyltransferase involved in cell wall biosynthesis